MTTTVYARLIWSRIVRFRNNLDERIGQADNKTKISTLNPRSFILIVSGILLIGCSFSYIGAYYPANIRDSFIALILGTILYTSVAGLQAEDIVKPVTRTLDLVGAPFVVAALLLANLFYFKI
jgi:multicomponent Na+:H+ antiporter subunit D